MFRLLFLLTIIFSISTSAMSLSTIFSVSSPETLSILMESLKLPSLDDQNTQDLTVLMNAMSLHKSPNQSKFEKIIDLAIALNVCLIKDQSYSSIKESFTLEYFPRNKYKPENCNKELSLVTREILKHIIRLSKDTTPNYALLEQAIYQIPSYNLKYILNTHGHPRIVEDTTSRYKHEMLTTLHG